MTRLYPKIGLHVVMAIGVLITIFPSVWVALMGTHTRGEIYSAPPPFYIGDNLLENYEKLLKIMPFWRKEKPF